MVIWGNFDRFDEAAVTYLPDWGEGDSFATQVCTAVNKLVYKWFNDGDVYDNSYTLTGWCNDLSSYANWLLKYAGAKVLWKIASCKCYGDYEDLLKELADEYLDKEYLDSKAGVEKVGSIYDCDGPFKFEERYEDEWEYEEDEYDYEEEF